MLSDNANQGINRLAVSQLRPGQLLADVERAWGNRWQPLKRKNEDRVWGKDVGVDCIVCIDAHGIAALCEPLDLSPLRELTRLESVDLAGGPHRGGQALLHCPQLRELACFADDLDDSSVLPPLRAKGVAVKVYE